MADKEEKIYYFARRRHMASVVWDPKRNSALAEFTKEGVYATKKKAKAQRLLDLGYLQVDKDEILARNLQVPVPDESHSANYQPGAPRGYSHAEDGQPTGQHETQPFVQLQEPGGAAPGEHFEEDFPSGPAAGKRTLR